MIIVRRTKAITEADIVIGAETETSGVDTEMMIDLDTEQIQE
jgi:hypothetical protein